MSLTIQFYTMLTMIGMGAFVGAALDTYHRFLKRSKRNLFYVFVNDILFWVLISIIIFYVLLQVNEGEMRIYVFLALLCGFSFYMSLIRNVYNKILEQIITLVIKTSKFIQKLFRIFILLPCRWIIHVIIVFVLGIFHIIMRILLFIKNVVQAILMWPIRLLLKLIPVKIKKNILKVKVFLLQVWDKVCNLYIRLKRWMKKS